LAGTARPVPPPRAKYAGVHIKSMPSVIFQDEVEVVERIPQNSRRFLTIQVLLTPLTKDDEGILPYVMQANHDMDKTTKRFGQQYH